MINLVLVEGVNEDNDVANRTWPDRTGLTTGPTTVIASFNWQPRLRRDCRPA
jgi:hypothetical protein